MLNFSRNFEKILLKNVEKQLVACYSNVTEPENEIKGLNLY